MRCELTSEEMNAAGLATVSKDTGSGDDWDRCQIREALLIEGFTLNGLERAAGLPSGAVNQALIKRYPKVDRVIAAVLKRELHEIWPNRYSENGESIRAVSGDTDATQIEGVRKELLEKGFTLRSFERKFDLPAGSAGIAIKRRFPKVDTLIAEVLGKPVYEIWPDRYYISGAPISRTYYGGKPTAENIQKVNESIERYKYIRLVESQLDGSRVYTFKISLPPGVPLLNRLNKHGVWNQAKIVRTCGPLNYYEQDPVTPVKPQ